MLKLPSILKLLANLQRSSIQDLSDRLNFGVSVYLIAIFALITGSKQHFGTPIQCMAPPESAGSWVDYYQDYCYIENKLKIKSLAGFSSERLPTEKLAYYQWIPYVLFLQSLSFLIPKLFWTAFSSSCGSGYELEIAITAVTKIRSLRGDKRSEAVKETSKYISDLLTDQRKTLLGRHGASLLFTSVKWLCVLNVVLQLEMLTLFVGKGDHFWGLDLIDTVIAGENNPENGVFPRVVMCDVSRLEMGGAQKNLMQCVLMMNYVNEKIFAFLWLWLIFVLFVTTMSALFRTFLTIVPPLRKWNILTLIPMQDLLFENSNEKGARRRQEKVLSHFIHQRLSGDGVLMVTYMREQAGALVTGEIVKEVYELSKPKKAVTPANRKPSAKPVDDTPKKVRNPPKHEWPADEHGIRIGSVWPTKTATPSADPVEDEPKKIRTPPKHEWPADDRGIRIGSVWPTATSTLLAQPPRQRCLSSGDLTISTVAVVHRVPSYATALLSSRQSINQIGSLAHLDAVDGNMGEILPMEEKTRKDE